jgi:hypothetical protein
MFCFLLIGISPVALFSQTNNTLTAKEKKEGWILLFNGTNASGWTTTAGTPAGWEVSNGTISVKKEAKAGDIISKDEFSDFELKMDFNIAPGGNSGVKYFFTTYEKGGKLGMEYQILDDQLAEDNKKDNHLTGSFYDVLRPDVSKKKVNAPGKWNTLRIVSKDKKVEHWLNGRKILEFVRGGKEYTDAVALSKFNQSSPAFGMVEKGHILLQDHGDEVAFRNIKIKKL